MTEERKKRGKSKNLRKKKNQQNKTTSIWRSPQEALQDREAKDPDSLDMVYNHEFLSKLFKKIYFLSFSFSTCVDIYHVRFAVLVSSTFMDLYFFALSLRLHEAFLTRNGSYLTIGFPTSEH